MWSATHQVLNNGTTKTTIRAGSRVLSFGEIAQLWRENDEFPPFFTSTIVVSEFKAFFWETPPITKTTLTRPFEFVLVSSPSLAGLRSDPSAFSEHFSREPTAQVVTFTNLGGDATLVVPTPAAAPEVYAHLASFLRRAAGTQSDALWKGVGAALASRISDVPVWLSTAGMGVSWLHVRLDSRPKYYRHAPYRSITRLD